MINRKYLHTNRRTTKKAINTVNRIDYSVYYRSHLWHDLRNSYIREHPLCEECLSNGIIKPAEEVHHKTPFSQGANAEERWELFLDMDNLQSLCHDCHKEKHKAIGLFGRKKDEAQ